MGQSSSSPREEEVEENLGKGLSLFTESETEEIKQTYKTICGPAGKEDEGFSLQQLQVKSLESECWDYSDSRFVTRPGFHIGFKNCMSKMN